MSELDKERYVVDHETGNIEIEHNESAHRFDTRVNGHLAFLQYRYSHNGDMVLVHTEVPGPLGGRGIGSKLARAALEYASSRELKVVPACPFISTYIKRHPEYESLVGSKKE
jgi:predicted GNAT family acetyltransferase